MNKYRRSSPRNISSRLISYNALLAATVLSVWCVFFHTMTVLNDIDRRENVQMPPTVETQYTEKESLHAKNTEEESVHAKNLVHPEDTATKYALRSEEAGDSTISNQINTSQNLNTGEKIIETVSHPARYAYNYVLGGIHESDLRYKGFLYTILMSVNLLKNLGSEADFWVWAQLSPNSTLDEIPDEEMRLFDALDIKVVKMEKPSYASFSSLMYDKFRALQKTEYKRFIYLDADILPLINLDFYFHLSDPDEKSQPTILRPNMNIATRKAPCNGGMFMMHPAVGAWEQLTDVVNSHREKVKKIEYPYFDFDNGWGHNFTEARDQWEGLKKNGTDWHFYGSVADQGLWYYYSKYVRKDVSIIVGEKIQTWIGDDKNSDLPVKVKESYGDLSKLSPKPIIYTWNCDDPSKNCDTTNMHIAHFVSDWKPWMMGIQRQWFDRKNDTHALNDAHRLWFNELYELNEKLHLGLNVYRWNKKHKDVLGQHPPFGLEPSWGSNAKDILGEAKLMPDTHHRYTKPFRSQQK